MAVYLPQVLYEDNHLIILSKPAGMPTQEDDSGDLDIFTWTKQYIKDKYQKPGEVYLGLLHRLDRPVSGLIVFARTSKAAARMSQMFQAHLVHKSYLAVVAHAPRMPEGRLTHFVRQSEGEKVIVKAYRHEQPGAKKAVLDYKTVGIIGNQGLLEVVLQTGRKHQIRVQLAEIGSWILGDLKYGAANPLPDKSIALHAWHLRFEHPVTKAVIDIRHLPEKGSHWEAFAGLMAGLNGNP